MSGREDVRPVVVVSGAAVMVSAVERMPFAVVIVLPLWPCMASACLQQVRTYDVPDIVLPPARHCV